MAWYSSRVSPCEYDAEADFVVRSVPSGQVFGVNRTRLEEGSSVFRDMFSCCDSGYVVSELDQDARMLDLDESAEHLSLLFHLLHAPPEPHSPPKVPKGSNHDFHDKVFHIQQTLPPDTVIPFPLIPTLLTLADKYALSDAILHVLHTHLAAYTSTHSLRVYGYAVSLGLETVAARASTYLLDPPLSSHTAQDISVIPNAEAYHRLVQLHAYRIKKLTTYLMGEEIFPHGYGKCPRHSAQTQEVWEDRKKVVCAKIQAGK
ncbi:hypothetical protein EUX98_g1846 [Antrodiella citrinella]|uniref:BTB domain-containing protein n=1 Tax=Antrodiella citrinella TaxID=2447956 RepID=A0A4S4N0F9_9APHY|nr:hypothetical protein EUX98_g1846 [Antrodiella citrinella]